MEKEVSLIVEKLRLIPHPEGGYYNEIYRSSEKIESQSLPERFGSSRNFSTSIYYLLEGEQVSMFHRLKSDELWHHYKGSAILLHCFENDRYTLVRLGDNLDLGQVPQFAVEAGTWFAAEVENKNSYSLAGCTVAPGFDFSDFELAERSELIGEYPGYSELIKKLTKEQ